VLRLDLQDLIDVALRRHDEFEPSVTVPKGGDRVGAQPHLRGDPGVSELRDTFHWSTAELRGSCVPAVSTSMRLPAAWSIHHVDESRMPRGSPR